MSTNIIIDTEQSEIVLPAYKSYIALISQSGTSSPVATIMQNTLGSIVWSRVSAGFYKGTLVGGFPAGKTLTPPFDVGSRVLMPLSKDTVNDYCYGFSRDNEDEVYLSFYDSDYVSVDMSTIYAAVSPENALLPIEIRVYP